MNEFVREILQKIPIIQKIYDSDPGKLYFNTQIFEAGHFVYARTVKNEFLWGYIADSRGVSSECRIDTGKEYRTVLRVNTYDGFRVDLVADILARFKILHIGLHDLREDVLAVVKKLYPVGPRETKNSLRDLLMFGSKNDQVCLDQLNLLGQNYVSPTGVLEKQIFLGIALTEDPTRNLLQKVGSWFAKVFNDNAFEKPVDQWCNKLYEAILVKNQYGTALTYENLKKTFFEAHPQQPTKTFTNPLYPSEFWWYKMVGHTFTKKIIKTAEYGYVYQVPKDTNRDFECYVPESSLIFTQPIVSSPSFPFKKGEFYTFPGENGWRYRYRVKNIGNGRFTTIQTLDKYDATVFSAYLTLPVEHKKHKFKQSLADNTKGTDLFQSVIVPDIGICMVTAITKNGEVAVFDGLQTVKVNSWKKNTDWKFKANDIVSCPFTEKPFDLGTVVFRREFHGGNREYAIQTDIRHGGVFYYPEGVLILQPGEDKPPPPPAEDLSKAVVLRPKVREQKKQQLATELKRVTYGDRLKQDIRYAAGATAILLLYALL